MKTTLLSVFAALFSVAVFAQSPTIEGDTMLCPEGFGTATIVTDQPYDSYQWQFRFAFSSDEFSDVAGETQSSFTYDYYNYSVTDIRVKVTLGGNTYYSNELFVDGYAFLPIFTIQNFDEEEASINPNDGSLLLCNGGSIEFSVGMPYNTNIQWYNGDEPIPGANSSTLTVSEAGDYYVTASPQACPDFQDSSLPVSVSVDPNCDLAVVKPVRMDFGFSPNPVRNELRFSSNIPVTKLELFDLAGKKLLTGAPRTSVGTIDLSRVSSGTYLLQATTANGQKTLKLIKE